jgi:hypothetical protein
MSEFKIQGEPRFAFLYLTRLLGGLSFLHLVWIAYQGVKVNYLI